MFLATHAIVGATTALSLRKKPLAALFAAFLSHFAADVIPHWDYRLASVVSSSTDYLKTSVIYDNRFIGDLFVTGADFAIGVAIAFLIAAILFRKYRLFAVLGAAAGVLPDFLQIIYFTFRNSPLIYLQKFHHWVQTYSNLSDQPLLGITLQIVTAAAAICLLVYFEKRAARKNAPRSIADN